MANSNNENIAFTGRCHCGRVRYACTSSVQNITYCYCIACRRLSGAPFIAWADIPFSAFKLDPGSSDPQDCALKPLSSDIAVRSVCSSCGSPITMKYLCDESIGVAAGTIEEGSLRERILGVSEHIFVGQKVGWYELPEDGAGRWERFTEGFEEELRAWKRKKTGQS